jgi:photosystem II stability/assembly factor-like uncharacterized protein
VTFLRQRFEERGGVKKKNHSFMSNICKIIFHFLVLYLTQNAFSEEQSIISPLVNQSLLLASDQSELLIVIVGERGHIVYSHNDEWIQATVPTKQTLTNVYMLDKKTGWAVGHDAVILKTVDGAKTWRKVFSDIKEEAPLLDLYFSDASNGIAIGAYSMMYVTSDGGVSWQKRDILIENNRGNENSDTSISTDVYDLHLNDIAYAGEKRFYIAAEAGHLLRTDDSGKTWQDLPSPYQGSFFGVLPLTINDLLAYGLRGHLYRSSDAGNSWQKIETSSKEMLTDAEVLSNGNIIVTGLSGTLLISKDDGLTFSNVSLGHRHGLSSVLETKSGSIILTGDAGIHILSQESLVSDD